MLGHSTTSNKYTVLQSNENTREGDDLPPIQSRKCSVLSSFLATICVVCTITNITIFFLSRTGPRIPDDLVVSRDALRRLRRPSQYIGLDEVIRPSPPIPVQFNNYPIVVASVDNHKQDVLFEVDARRFMSPSGMISSEARRVLVTDTVSTVVQFRAIDYGMEICELHVDLPRLLPNTTSYPGQNAMVSLFRLSASLPVDVKTLSRDTRPARLFKVADIQLSSEGISRWRRKMACASEEVLSFELASFGSDYGCHVEWWQDREDPSGNPGIYITQHATV